MVSVTVEFTRAAKNQTDTWEPTVTPELIGILAVGATVIGLMLTFRRDARADLAEVRSDLAELRKDVQALTERMSRLEGRMSRLEGVIEGFFAGRDRRDDAPPPQIASRPSASSPATNH